MRGVFNMVLDIVAILATIVLVAATGLLYVLYSVVMMLSPEEIIFTLVVVAFISWRIGRFLAN